MHDIKQILFVCTGNTCRSAAAEGFLRAFIDREGLRDIQVLSRGISALPFMRSPEPVIRLMDKEGINMRSHGAQPLTTQDIDSASLILAMERAHQRAILSQRPKAKSKTFLLKEYVRASGPSEIPDPISQPLTVYTRCIQEIRGCVDKLLEKLKEDQLEKRT